MLGLMIHSKSSCTPLPDTMYEVRNLLLRHQERIQKHDRYNENSAIIGAQQIQDIMTGIAPQHESIGRKKAPEALHIDCVAAHFEKSNISSGGVESGVFEHDKGVSMLAVCMGEPAPDIFEIKANIVGTMPPVDAKSVNDLVKLCVPDLNGGTPTSTIRDNLRSKEAPSKMVYQFAFRLNDGTGEIAAIVPDEIGEACFGVSATQLCQNTRDGWSARKGASQQLQEAFLVESIFHGVLRSICIGNEKYFILAGPLYRRPEL